LLDNRSRSPADEYTSVSYVYEPLNKLLNMLLPHLKFERVDISDTDPPKCIFSKYTRNGMFCPCWGMALRASPTDKRDKEKPRRK